MCRLFGFRSVIQSQVHQSLVSADNALLRQSHSNPDGWGIAYFLADAPHVIKSSSGAIDDNLFQRVSGVVSSETVLAHVRKATQGSHSIINTHPFQYGRWVFAHNGNIARFDELRPILEAKVAPTFRRFLLGQTDSELLFYLILTHLSRRVELHRLAASFEDVATATREALDEVRSVAGDYCRDDDGAPTETFLTFLLTNGSTMIAHRGGKELYYSTYKNRCSVRGSCPYLSESCEAPTSTGYLNHLIFASEPLQGENVWVPLENGMIVGVDSRMRLEIREEAAKAGA